MTILYTATMISYISTLVSGKKSHKFFENIEV